MKAENPIQIPLVDIVIEDVFDKDSVVASAASIDELLEAIQLAPLSKNMMTESK